MRIQTSLQIFQSKIFAIYYFVDSIVNYQLDYMIKSFIKRKCLNDKSNQRLG